MLRIAGDDLGERSRPAVALTVGDADRDSAWVLRERGHAGTFVSGAPAILELAGFPAGEGLYLRQIKGRR